MLINILLDANRHLTITSTVMGQILLESFQWTRDPNQTQLIISGGPDRPHLRDTSRSERHHPFRCFELDILKCVRTTVFTRMCLAGQEKSSSYGQFHSSGSEPNLEWYVLNFGKRGGGGDVGRCSDVKWSSHPANRSCREHLGDELYDQFFKAIPRIAWRKKPTWLDLFDKFKSFTAFYRTKKIHICLMEERRGKNPLKPSWNKSCEMRRSRKKSISSGLLKDWTPHFGLVLFVLKQQRALQRSSSRE